MQEWQDRMILCPAISPVIYTYGKPGFGMLPAFAFYDLFADMAVLTFSLPAVFRSAWSVCESLLQFPL